MRKFINAFESGVKKVCYYVCFAAMLMVVLMMLLMFVDALLGKLFNSRMTGSYELVQCMLCILVFTSWAYTQTEHGHINVVMFVRKMHRVPRFIMYAATSVLSVVTISIGAYGVYLAMLGKMANHESTGTLLIPLWPFYLFEFVAFVFLAIALLCDAIKAIAAIANKEIGDDIMQHWT